MEIRVNHLSKKIGGTQVLKDIDYIFSGGNIYGLSGKNGCGKTMLMRCISGLVYPTEGNVSIDGSIIGKDISFPPSIGILIENPSFLNSYTGFENLQILAKLEENVSDKDIVSAMNKVGLDADDKRKYYKYSLGMKQRLGIAAAIMNSPKLLILDEPINAIDGEGVLMIKKVIREMISDDRIIIIACHDKDEMDFLADRIIYMSEGRIIS